MRAKYASYAIAAILVGTAALSQGDTTYTWTGASDGDWSNTANWVDDTLPAVNAAGAVTSEDAGSINTIVIQAGANQPLSNIPTYANKGGGNRTPKFVVEAGAALEITADADHYDAGTCGSDRSIATVASGGTLSMRSDASGNFSIARDGDAIHSFDINGTFNLYANRLDFGFGSNRASAWTLDGGTVNLSRLDGAHMKVNMYGSRASDSTTTSMVTLKNGGTWNGGFWEGNFTNGAIPLITFDIHEAGCTANFHVGAVGKVQNVAQAEAMEGILWTSSTLGSSNLTYSLAGGILTIGVEGTLPSANLYDDWVALYPTLGASTNYTDDFEPDGMNNLMEYALGGDPSVDDAASIMPVSAVDSAMLNYIYQRQNPQDPNLTYTVLDGANLVLGLVNTNTTDTASGVIVDGYETVTNSVSTTVEGQQFMQLQMELSE